jgi:putative ABC transport system ATP-binding protein
MVYEKRRIRFMLEVVRVTHRYPLAEGRELTILREVSFAVAASEVLAIMGPSGSGKTTLIGLCAGLETPSEGKILLAGQDLATLSDRDRSRLRNRSLGFVFQSFHLIPALNALENVLLPAELAGRRDRSSAARTLLEQVGLADRQGHFPRQLSGGEQQRLALARAFINQPSLVFADEPTGNLDFETSGRVQDLLLEMNRQHNTTLVLVTHDRSLAQRAGKVLVLEGGRLRSASHGEAGNPGAARLMSNETASALSVKPA